MSVVFASKPNGLNHAISRRYNTFANTAGQIMTLAILIVGAWVVMTEPAFAIGMLIAFQMFAAKLSQLVRALSK